MISSNAFASRFVHPDPGFGIGASVGAVIEQARNRRFTLLPEL
jgi:hypothetical protein